MSQKGNYRKDGFFNREQREQEQKQEANNNVWSAFCRELPSWVDAEKFMRSVIKRNPKQTIIK